MSADIAPLRKAVTTTARWWLVTFLFIAAVGTWIPTRATEILVWACSLIAFTVAGVALVIARQQRRRAELAADTAAGIARNVAASLMPCTALIPIGPNYKTICWRPAGHDGEHAVKITALEHAGWVCPPF